MRGKPQGKQRDEAGARRDPREVLQGTPKGTVADWLAKHPEVQEFLETWLEMASAGESDKSPAWVLRYVQEEYGFPFSSYGITKWFRARDKDRYQQAITNLGLERG